jgi:hypothetical protein
MYCHNCLVGRWCRLLVSDEMIIATRSKLTSTWLALGGAILMPEDLPFPLSSLSFAFMTHPYTKCGFLHEIARLELDSELSWIVNELGWELKSL